MSARVELILAIAALILLAVMCWSLVWAVFGLIAGGA